jgi:hypothetical protein
VLYDNSLTERIHLERGLRVYEGMASGLFFDLAASEEHATSLFNENVKLAEDLDAEVRGCGLCCVCLSVWSGLCRIRVGALGRGWTVADPPLEPLSPHSGQPCAHITRLCVPRLLNHAGIAPHMLFVLCMRACVLRCVCWCVPVTSAG